MVTSILSELVMEEPQELPAVPLPPNASITQEPAFADAKKVIAEVQAATMERKLMESGYLEMASELLEWSETTLAAQAETLPE